MTSLNNIHYIIFIKLKNSKKEINIFILGKLKLFENYFIN